MSQMGELTLMAVHAHPDDEAISTPGVLAKYSLEGVRTVVVTCTDGALGFGPGRSNPGEPGHDPVALAVLRRAELERSCAHLGVRHLEVLGYHDSGMAGWESNRHPDAFCNAPIGEVADRLASLIEPVSSACSCHLRFRWWLRPSRPHPDSPRHDGRAGTHRGGFEGLPDSSHGRIPATYACSTCGTFAPGPDGLRAPPAMGTERRSNHDEG